jgi:hypothetical protein
MYSVNTQSTPINTTKMTALATVPAIMTTSVGYSANELGIPTVGVTAGSEDIQFM